MTKMLMDPGEAWQVQLPEGAELCGVLEGGMWRFDCAGQNQVPSFYCLSFSSRKHPFQVCVYVLGCVCVC